MKKMILLSAQATGGKTTFANMLKEQLEAKGKKVCIMRYASNIKRILTDFYGWKGEKTDYWREKLQNLGTEIIRIKMNRPMFHVQRVCEDIEIIQDDFDYVIIDDCRFPNEIKYPEAVFGDKVLTVRLHRLNYESPLTPEQQAHPSERALDGYTNYDKEIWMGTGLDIIEREVKRFVKEALDE